MECSEREAGAVGSWQGASGEMRVRLVGMERGCVRRAL